MQLLCILQLLLMCCTATAQVSYRRYRVEKRGCLNASLSAWRNPRSADSIIDCFISSRSFDLGRVGVVQWNARDTSCALFRFGQVCRLLSLTQYTQSPAATDQTDCETLVDSEYDAFTANKHFNAVWVGDRGPALENLVCGSDGQKNPMRSSDVNWTSEGARMNGVSSKMWTDDPSGMNFTMSYTWLAHMKRDPGQSSFIELSSCVGSGSMLDHLQEYSGVSGVSRPLYLNPGKNARFQTGNLLPADPEKFFIAGVSFKRHENQTQFYFESSFQPAAYVLTSTNSFSEDGACIRVGHRYNGIYMMRGVVRAVAASNLVMEEAIVRKLFINN